MMFDLHSHVLPGIDDGAKNVEESLNMLSDSYVQGITLCVCTPHIEVYDENSINVFLEKRKQSADSLYNAVGEKGVTVPERVLGAEVYLFNDISCIDNVDKLCIGQTNYMLIELSTKKYNPNYSEWLYSLSLKNIVPIIAHIERYPYIDELIEELRDIEVVYQINAQTLLKRKWIKRLKQMSEMGLSVVCSSDMHNMKLRRNRMKDAFIKLSAKNPELAQKVFNDNSRKILNK